MTNPSLSDLGVNAQNVEHVEHAVVAQAEAEAHRAQVEEHQINLNKLDEQLANFRLHETELLDSSFTAQRKRRLSSLQKKIQNLQENRMKLLESNQARRELSNTNPLIERSVSDNHRNEGESERDFLIRTGRVTPFQGYVGYERAEDKSSAIVSQKLTLTYKDTSKRLIPPHSIEPFHASSRELTQISAGNLAPKTHRNLPSGKKGSDEDEYVPSLSEEANLSDQNIPGYETNKKRIRLSNDEIDFADDEVERTVDDPRMEEKEGDAWIMEDDEEVEFAGGLRIPSSMYEKLFDYQRTGVRNANLVFI